MTRLLLTPQPLPVAPGGSSGAFVVALPEGRDPYAPVRFFVVANTICPWSAATGSTSDPGALPGVVDGHQFADVVPSRPTGVDHRHLALDVAPSPDDTHAWVNLKNDHGAIWLSVGLEVDV